MVQILATLLITCIFDLQKSKMKVTELVPGFKGGGVIKQNESELANIDLEIEQNEAL